MAGKQTEGGAEDVASPPSIPVTKEKVSQDFSHLYFKILNEEPGLLHQFYGDDSSVVACESHDEGPTFKIQAENKEDIKTHLEIFKNITVEVSTCAPQFSMEDSILLVVTGNMLRKGLGEDEERLFTQAFLLAKQAEGFYVRTDTLQIHSNRCSTNILSNRPKLQDDVPPSAPATPPKAQSKKEAHISTTDEVSPTLVNPPMPKSPAVSTTPSEPLVKDQVPHDEESSSGNLPSIPVPAAKAKPLELPTLNLQAVFNKSPVEQKYPSDFAEKVLSEIPNPVLPVFGSMSVEEIDPSFRPGAAGGGGGGIDMSFGEISAKTGNGGLMGVEDRNEPERYGEVVREVQPTRNMAVDPRSMPRKPPVMNQKDQAVEPPNTHVKPIEKPFQMPAQRPPVQYPEANLDFMPSGGAPYKRKSYVDALRNPGGHPLAENRVTPTSSPTSTFNQRGFSRGRTPLQTETPKQTQQKPVSAALSRLDVRNSGSTPTVQNGLHPTAPPRTTAAVQTTGPPPPPHHARVSPDKNFSDNPRNRESNRARKGVGKVNDDFDDFASEIELRSRLTSLFVCRLPPDVTARSIEEIFTKFGKLRTEVRVLTGPKNCYTFVNYVSEDSVRAALAAEIKVGSETIVVERWQPKRDFRKKESARY